MRIGWLGGWAVPVDYIKNIVTLHYPKDEHLVLYPGRYWKRRIETCDLWIGYSLGGYLMRKEGFGEGGKIIGAFDRFGKKTELKYLRKWLKRDAKEAIEDFYRKAELDIKVEGLPYPMDDLDWGLEQLQGDGSLSENYEMYCGERDSLIVEKKGIQLEKVGHSLEDYISNGIWK